jgi:hypothetical protein
MEWETRARKSNGVWVSNQPKPQPLLTRQQRARAPNQNPPRRHASLAFPGLPSGLSAIRLARYVINLHLHKD